MATSSICITIEDHSFFTKNFKISHSVDIKKVLDCYRRYLCKCTEASIFDFYYDGTKLVPGQTPKLLGLLDGDVIDVVTTEPCTRGSCPIPEAQIAQNIHYLSEPVLAGAYVIPARECEETDEQHPCEAKRIVISLETRTNLSLRFRIKFNTKLKHIMDATSYYLGQDIIDISFKIEGEYINASQSVEDWLRDGGNHEEADAVEDGTEYQIDVYWKSEGGGQMPGTDNLY